MSDEIDRDEIKRRREALGLTMEEAAQRAGFSGRQRWNGIEKGERQEVAFSTIVAVAKALGCTCDDLIKKPRKK